MQGFIKVVASGTYDKRHAVPIVSSGFPVPTYMALVETSSIQVYPTIEQFGQSESLRHLFGDRYAEVFPIYLLNNASNNQVHMVDPCERERMERIITGTDNPMYDLLHELRYNPVIGSRVEEARNHFNTHKSNAP